MKHLDLDDIDGLPFTIKFDIVDSTGLPENISNSNLKLEVFNDCNNVVLSKTVYQTDVFTLTSSDLLNLKNGLYSYRLILISSGRPSFKAYSGLFYIDLPNLYVSGLRLWEDHLIWNDDITWIESV